MEVCRWNKVNDRRLRLKRKLQRNRTSFTNEQIEQLEKGEDWTHHHHHLQHLHHHLPHLHHHPGLDKIKTFRDRSLNFLNFPLKWVNYDNKICDKKYKIFEIRKVKSNLFCFWYWNSYHHKNHTNNCQIVSNNMFVSVTNTLFPSKCKQKRIKFK